MSDDESTATPHQAGVQQLSVGADGEVAGLEGTPGSSSAEMPMIFTEEKTATVEDHLRALLVQQEDYARNTPSATTPAINETWRLKLCEWCYQVVDHYQFDREVVFYAMSYLDRSFHLYQLQAAVFSRRDYQRYAVTSLYLAIKLHGEQQQPHRCLNSVQQRYKLRLSAFVSLSRSLFSGPQIEATELDMIQSLQWRVHPPTPARFLATLLELLASCCITPAIMVNRDSSLANSMARLEEVARYLIELALCHSCFLVYPASVLAYAALLCAEDLDKNNNNDVSPTITWNFQSKLSQYHSLEEIAVATSIARQLACLCPGGGPMDSTETASTASATTSATTTEHASISPTTVMDEDVALSDNVMLRKP